MVGHSFEEHRGIVLFAIGLLILGGVFGTVTLFYYAPDEIQNYFHVVRPEVVKHGPVT